MSKEDSGALSLEEALVSETLATYDQHADAYAARNDGVRLPYLDQFLDQVPPDGLILDAGCGTGRDALRMKEDGWTVLAMDASRGMLEVASAKGVDTTLGDLRNLPLEAERADGVWMNASLLHVPYTDVQRVFREVARVLKDGGVLMVTVKEGEGVLTDEFEGSLRHFTLFTEHELRDFALVAGLTDVSVDYDYETSRACTWLILSARKVSGYYQDEDYSFAVDYTDQY